MTAILVSNQAVLSKNIRNSFSRNLAKLEVSYVVSYVYVYSFKSDTI